MFKLNASTPCTPAIKCLRVPRTREVPDNNHDNHRCLLLSVGRTRTVRKSDLLRFSLLYDGGRQ